VVITAPCGRRPGRDGFSHYARSKVVFRQLAVDFPLPKAELSVCETKECEKVSARTESKIPSRVFFGGVHFHDGSADRSRHRPVDLGVD